jgi:uncharacterized protein (DUF2267 family)
MPEPGYSVFATTLDKTNRPLKEIETYGWPKARRNQSYAVFRAVLHALRDRLTVEAALLAAQLPMLIRGLYYEGWKPASVPVKMNREASLGRVRPDFGFDVVGGTEHLIRTVLEGLRGPREGGRVGRHPVGHAPSARRPGAVGPSGPGAAPSGGLW